MNRNVFLIFLVAVVLSWGNVFAETIPILDLSDSHDYSLFAKAGIPLTVRNPKTSQSILAKKFKVSFGAGRTISFGEETNKPVNQRGLVWCPPKETDIQFISIGSGYLTTEQGKQMISEIRAAFGWLDDDFEKTINSASGFQKCLKSDMDANPCYSVQVEPSYIKETPIVIKLTIAWNSAVLERVVPEAGVQSRLDGFRQQSVRFENNTNRVDAGLDNEEKTAQKFFQLCADGNYRQLPQLFDPKDLSRVRQILSYYDNGSGKEYGDSMRKAHFGKAATMASVAKLSNEDFYGQVLKVNLEITVSFFGGLTASNTNSKPVQIVGKISERDSAHLLVRQFSTDNYTHRIVTNMTVLTLKQQLDKTWRVVINDDAFNALESEAKRIAE